jgi:hypothetical protein
MNGTAPLNSSSWAHIYNLRTCYSHPELKALEGRRPSQEHYDLVIRDEALGLCDQTGRIVFALCKGALPNNMVELAKKIFGDIDTRLAPSYSRSSAAGNLSIESFMAFRKDIAAVHADQSNPYQGFIELKSGKRFAKALSNPVKSYMAGFNYDRFRKLGNPCGFSRKFPAEWLDAIPFFEEVSLRLDHALPEVSSKMHKWCRENQVSSRFTIGNACLTTVAINVNYESCFHYDRGDLDDGYSTLTAVSTGNGYAGGYLVLPKYRVAIDLRPGDILLNQSHADLHGNTAIIPADHSSKRISFVTYLKKTLRHATNK